MQALRVQAVRAAEKIVEDLAGGRSAAYASHFASSATIIAPECNYVPSTPEKYLLSMIGRDQTLPVLEYRVTHQQVALLQHVAVVTQHLTMNTWSEAGTEPVHVTSTIILHKVAANWVAIHEHRSRFLTSCM